MLNNYFIYAEFVLGFSFEFWPVFVLFFVKVGTDAETKNKFKFYSVLHYRLLGALEKLLRIFKLSLKDLSLYLQRRQIISRENKLFLKKTSKV